ncbi:MULTISPECIES: hypothetical protein [unclassified Paenibacillus]|uniref:hypothetical protein n=1 Tax=unclassified Paenibacillus TaxID=185978 RepID=UPI0009A5B74F|nr:MULTISPECIES: hypothetical protein [unclassified Paenibacillus]SLK17352.1 hypothetical protein SAMN06272722_11174 [Paenibacillus sp. RU5A]SOC74724.1 hypothetical protein SAMN05880581_11174 [Paenibacillus sp. RU26A]SOC76862.1 hypothetical protein SAMN05880586_11174 [Paenibacillus sp. RU5M]
MKKSIVSGFLSLFMFFGLMSSVGAQSSNEINEGIVPALTEAVTASEDTIDNHLKEMGFFTNEISTMSIDMKREIASNDGKKVAAQELNTLVTVTDESGETTVGVASTNQLKAAASATPTISGYAVYGGTSNNGKERIYQVYATYRWSSSPFNFYTDYLAMAWQANATPTGTPNGQHSVLGSTAPNKVDKEEVSGTSWKVDIKAGGDTTVQEGWGRQELRYPTTSQGISTAIAVGYSHRTLPGFTTGVSLSFGVVSFSGTGKVDYTGRFTFTI